MKLALAVPLAQDSDLQSRASLPASTADSRAAEHEVLAWFESRSREAVWTAEQLRAFTIARNQLNLSVADCKDAARAAHHVLNALERTTALQLMDETTRAQWHDGADTIVLAMLNETSPRFWSTVCAVMDTWFSFHDITHAWTRYDQHAFKTPAHEMIERAGVQPVPPPGVVDEIPAGESGVQTDSSDDNSGEWEDWDEDKGPSAEIQAFRTSNSNSVGPSTPIAESDGSASSVLTTNPAQRRRRTDTVLLAPSGSLEDSADARTLERAQSRVLVGGAPRRSARSSRLARSLPQGRSSDTASDACVWAGMASVAALSGVLALMVHMRP